MGDKAVYMVLPPGAGPVDALREHRRGHAGERLKAGPAWRDQGSPSQHHRRAACDEAENSPATMSAMAEQTQRALILQALETLPPDATFDDAIERLVFLAKIEAGLAELDAGEGIPHQEVRHRLGL